MDKFDEIKSQLEQIRNDLAALVRLVEADAPPITVASDHKDYERQAALVRRAETTMPDAAHYFSARRRTSETACHRA